MSSIRAKDIDSGAGTAMSSTPKRVPLSMLSAERVNRTPSGGLSGLSGGPQRVLVKEKPASASLSSKASRTPRRADSYMRPTEAYRSVNGREFQAGEMGRRTAYHWVLGVTLRYSSPFSCVTLVLRECILILTPQEQCCPWNARVSSQAISSPITTDTAADQTRATAI